MHVPFTNFKLNSSLLHYIGLLALLTIGHHVLWDIASAIQKIDH